MPIRFECDQCGQRLSIARRKVGTNIDCPTCGLGQRVPGEPCVEDQVEENEAEIAEDPRTASVSESLNAVDLEDESVDGGTEIEEDQSPFVVATSSAQPPPIPDAVDLSKTIDLNYLAEASVVPATGAPPPPPARSEAEHEFAQPVPRLPVPWAVYAQALLLLSVAIGAFSVGYYLGRQDGSVLVAKPTEPEVVMAEPDDGFTEEEVLLEGRILWTPSPGKSSGDELACFIALPQDRIPQSSLPITGLRPGSQHSADTQASVVAIRGLGGVFSQAEIDGTLAAVLPREGRYYVLMISKNVKRSENQPILDEDLVQMKQYFAEPEALIGASKYVWEPVEMRVGAPAVEHDFGLDGL